MSNEKLERVPKLRFPEFGGEWESRKLGDIYETTSGGTPLKSKNEYYNTGVIPWLTSGEVAQGLIYKSKQTITELGLRKSSAKIFPKNTVLIAMYGATVGKIGLLKFKSSTNQAICGILPNDKFISEFLYQYLTIQTKMIAGLSGGGAQPNISQTIIKALEVPFPLLKEQQKIADCLTSLDELITLQTQKLDNLKTHKKGLMQQLFPATNEESR
jgi:type I restriction enzyme S subunit